MVDGIVTGGYETTASTISMGTAVVLRDPAHAALVRYGSRADVERVVEELLRYLTVVQVAFPRFAKRDLELFGCPVRKDDVVAVSLSGADRDPAWAGPHPDRFDPAGRPPAAGTWPSGTGCTAASAPNWPGWSCASSCRHCSAASPTSLSPSRRNSSPGGGCPSSTASRNSPSRSERPVPPSGQPTGRSGRSGGSIGGSSGISVARHQGDDRAGRVAADLRGIERRQAGQEVREGRQGEVGRPGDAGLRVATLTAAATAPGRCRGRDRTGSRRAGGRGGRRLRDHRMGVDVRRVGHRRPGVHARGDDVRLGLGLLEDRREVAQVLRALVADAVDHDVAGDRHGRHAEQSSRRRHGALRRVVDGTGPAGQPTTLNERP